MSTYTTNRRVAKLLAYAEKLGLRVAPMDFNGDPDLPDGFTVSLDWSCKLWVYSIGTNGARVSHWLGFGTPRAVTQWYAGVLMAEAAQAIARRAREEASK